MSGILLNEYFPHVYSNAIYRVFNQLPEDPLTSYSGDQMLETGVVSCSKFDFVTEIFEVR